MNNMWFGWLFAFLYFWVGFLYGREFELVWGIIGWNLIFLWIILKDFVFKKKGVKK